MATIRLNQLCVSHCIRYPWERDLRDWNHPALMFTESQQAQRQASLQVKGLCQDPDLILCDGSCLIEGVS